MDEQEKEGMENADGEDQILSTGAIEENLDLEGVNADDLPL